MKKFLILFQFVFIFILSGCSQHENLLIVTTTSLENSGLLEYILPLFEDEYDIDVHVVAVGTGAALELGRNGDADILLVHDYDREMEFMDNGYGEKSHNIMYNDFVIVGPEVLVADSLSEALEQIYALEYFYSRGDQSGTHAKEVKMWVNSGYDPTMFSGWYKETGQSMGATLNMASLRQYYTLSDRATYLSMKVNLDLVISYENAEELLNQYSVIKVDPSLHNRNDDNSELFYNWIIRSDIQDFIATYIAYEEQLFYPNAGD